MFPKTNWKGFWTRQRSKEPISSNDKKYSGIKDQGWRWSSKDQKVYICRFVRILFSAKPSKSGIALFFAACNRNLIALQSFFGVFYWWQSPMLLCFTMLRKEGWTQPKGAGYLHPWDCETISYTITCILNIYHIQLHIAYYETISSTTTCIIYVVYCIIYMYNYKLLFVKTISYRIIHCLLWNYILYNDTYIV